MVIAFWANSQYPRRGGGQAGNSFRIANDTPWRIHLLIDIDMPPVPGLRAEPRSSDRMSIPIIRVVCPSNRNENLLSEGEEVEVEKQFVV